MGKRVSIKTFVNELIAALNRHDGYIMGSRGQNPRTGYLDLNVPESQCKSSWKPNGYFFTQYSGSKKTKALSWRKNCTRVWDCNGMAEGIYEIYTGININSKARYNYRDWCAVKGKGMIPVEYRVPGAAVFWSDGSSSSIHHVGYLIEPVEKGYPSGDWYIIEARGVMYGVVKTRLYSRKPNFWGLMTLYYDYENTGYNENTTNTIVTDREHPVLKYGDENEYVKIVQSMLIKLGYDLGRYGADGDFGGMTRTAVENFQRANDLDIDGIVGEKTWQALENAFANSNKPPVNAKYVVIVGGNEWIHTEPNTDKETRIAVGHEGDKFPFIEEDEETRWYKILYREKECFVSFKYAKLVG